MPDEYELTGLNLFNDRATAAGGFPSSVLGYDKQSVDAYVRQLESEVVELRHSLSDAMDNLATAQRQAAQSDLGRLTGHAAVMLNSAEAEAGRLKLEADLNSNEVINTARKEAEELRAAAIQESEDIRSTSLSAMRGLRDQQHHEFSQTMAAARIEADNIVIAARHHGESLVKKAENDASAIVANAEQQALQIRAIADRDAAEARNTAATEVARSLSEAQERAAAMHNELVRQHEAGSAHLAEQTALAAQLRNESSQHAEQIRVHAVREAEQHLTATRKAAAELRTRLDAEANRRVEQLQREISVLEQRKEALGTQLGHLAGLGRAALAEFPEAESQWPVAAYPTELSTDASTSEDGVDTVLVAEPHESQVEVEASIGTEIRPPHKPSKPASTKATSTRSKTKSNDASGSSKSKGSQQTTPKTDNDDKAKTDPATVDAAPSEEVTEDPERTVIRASQGE